MSIARPAEPSGSTDRIERHTVLRSPRPRVWQAVADPREFGAWFGAAIDAERFEPGVAAPARITHPGFEHFRFNFDIVAVEPERRLAFHWHPYAVKEGVDYSTEHPTLVEFLLEDEPGGGTRLTVVESGFDRVPAPRREEAFRMNSRGWDAQMTNVARHVDGK